MLTRTTSPALAASLALLSALLLAPGIAAAQIQGPAPVDESDQAPPPLREEPPAGREAPGGPRPTATLKDPSPEPGPPPDPTDTRIPDTLPAPRAAPAPPAPARPMARAIEPVTVTFQQLQERWAARRAALREQDPAKASAAAAAILDIRRQLAIENLIALSAAEVREVGRSLDANLPAAALEHAEVAVKLAPDFPDAHLAYARARFARAPGEPLAALSALGEAFSAALREPHTLRAIYGDLASALFAALFAASALTILLLALRSLRLLLHDFHHLPVLREATTIQAAFLGLVLLAVPVAFGLGPFLVLATLVLAAWLYLSQQERIAMTLALLLVTALPWAAGEVARAAAWTGSLAEEVYELEHGAFDDQQVADLVARVGEAPPAAVSAALGRHFKRRGDLAAAERWYERAVQADPRAAELLVNAGNVRFLRGDLDGAKAAYLNASDRAGGDLTVLAAAHYDLSKLYLRGSDIEKSSAARDRAELEDGPFLRRYGADDDFSANRYLVDVPVPAARIQALATGDGTPEAMRDALQARIAGPLPRQLWPWLPLGLVAFLWVVAAASRLLAPAHACERCGRPACRRCDGGAGPLCGQCVNVFVKKGVVEARDRLRKDAEVRRHRQLVLVGTRLMALLGGGAGHVIHGLAGRGFAGLVALAFVGFLVWFWRGLMPPPQPSPYVLWGKLLVAVPLGLAVYLWTVRDVFRRTGA